MFKFKENEKKRFSFDELAERIVFLKLLMPKNFNRISPLVYLFWGSIFAFIFSLFALRFFWALAVVSGFIIVIWGLFLYLWKNPLV